MGVVVILLFYGIYILLSSLFFLILRQWFRHLLTKTAGYSLAGAFGAGALMPFLYTLGGKWLTLLVYVLLALVLAALSARSAIPAQAVMPEMNTSALRNTPALSRPQVSAHDSQPLPSADQQVDLLPEPGMIDQQIVIEEERTRQAEAPQRAGWPDAEADAAALAAEDVIRYDLHLLETTDPFQANKETAIAEEEEQIIYRFDDEPPSPSRDPEPDEEDTIIGDEWRFAEEDGEERR